MELIEDVLSGDDRPTAIVAVSYKTVLGIYTLAKKLGLEIGRDFIGYVL